MAGHSKWANIKHRKGVNDAKKAKLYTKIIKEITVACKELGPDISSNSRLRLAVQNAKGANVPKETIDRAIKKSIGDENTTYQVVFYEGNILGKIAVIVECMTDNINRSVSFVRSIFNKFGGNLGKKGSTSYLFDRQGFFIFNSEKIKDHDKFILEIIDAGVDEVEEKDGLIYLSCTVANFGLIQHKLELLNIELQSAGLHYIPLTFVTLPNEDISKLVKFIESLEGHDDVQKIYHNIDVKQDQISLFE